MRTLKLQMQLSVDGFVAGPNGEMDWMTWNWDDSLKHYVTQITEPVDCIILGRKLAQGFIPHWAAAANNPEMPDGDFAKRMHETPKIVFSKTLHQSEWENTHVANGDVVEVVCALKQQPGKDIIVYGGANFVGNMVKKSLIDDFYLFVNPAAIGSGMPIFLGRTNLKLVEATPFNCGVVALHYQPLH